MSDSTPIGERPSSLIKAPRMPVVSVPHGGGPWPFVETGFGDALALGRLKSYIRALHEVPPVPPKAVLVVSAHWEEAVPTVMTSAHPPLLFDYFGFPQAAYELTWPAPGEPALADRVRALLGAAGFETGADAERGFDHGAFVPLKLTYPEADMPTVQLSLKKGLDPKEHLAMGRALAPLRDEGVFIVGSGMSYHNMRGFNGGATSLASSKAFDDWLNQIAALPAEERDAALVKWSEAPAARLCHPREEHLLPFMVVAGAAGSDRGRNTFSDSLLDVRVSGHQFG